MSDSDGGYQYNINNTDDDAPGLEMMSNSDIDEDDKYVEDEQTREMMAALADVLLDGFLKHEKETTDEKHTTAEETKNERCPSLSPDEEQINWWLSEILTENQLFPGDGHAIDPTYEERDPRFIVEQAKLGLVTVYDQVQGFDSHLHFSVIQSPGFSVVRWYAEQYTFNSGMPRPWKVAQQWVKDRFGEPYPDPNNKMELGGVQVDQTKYLLGDLPLVDSRYA